MKYNVKTLSAEVIVEADNAEAAILAVHRSGQEGYFDASALDNEADAKTIIFE